MNKPRKVTGKMILAITQIFALSLLAACSAVGSPALDASLMDGKVVTACHATGDSSNPYQEITITSDIFPVPAYGCPNSPVAISNGKIAICHATSNETKPYNLITVSVMGLNGHGTHENDVYPLEDGECPDTVQVSDDKITICHATGSETNPYNEITVSINGLNGHDQHEGDIIPMPESGCPTTN